MTVASFSNLRWNKAMLREQPLQTIGISLFLIGRYIFVAFFIYGFWHKFVHEWLWTDVLKQFFLKRLGESDLTPFQASYLEHFGIPVYMPISWVVTVGELIIGLGLIFGIATRANAAFALFLFINFAAGGYYNLTLPPLMLFAVLLMVLPSGHWLGYDKTLSEKYPNSIWFK
jgi:thiosulfate dehydrogenase [quinone] large subunit